MFPSRMNTTQRKPGFCALRRASIPARPLAWHLPSDTLVPSNTSKALPVEAACGAHRFAIFSESFQKPALNLQAATGPFTVRFANSSVAMTWTPAEGTVLSLAARQGQALPSGCQVGQCVSCLLQIRSGQVAHLAEVDLQDERSCLSCVAVPASDLVLEA